MTTIRTVEKSFLPKQALVMQESSAFNIVYEGGAGSGKTTVGAWWTVVRGALQNPPGLHHLVVAPTYPIIMMVIVPALKDVFAALGVPFTYNKTDKCFTLPGERLIWIRSADDPDKMVGSNIATAWCDEAAQFSDDMLKRILQRVREGRANRRQILYTSTPEGTKTALYRLVRAAEETNDPNTRVIRSNTFENWHNGKDWMDEVARRYANDPAGRRQYLEGIATDSSGNIYTSLQAANITQFERMRFDRTETVLGGDFNVHYMVTVVGAWDERKAKLHICGEVITRSANGTNTDAHYHKVREYLCTPAFRGGHYESGMMLDNTNKHITVAIDASGKNPHSAAIQTDEAMVRNAGFKTWHMGKNPEVQDRINTVNAALAAGKLLIDPRAAPETLRAMKEHSWDKHGEPQKRWNKDDHECDHYMDALGYLVYRLLPLKAGNAWRSS